MWLPLKLMHTLEPWEAASLPSCFPCSRTRWPESCIPKGNLVTPRPRYPLGLGSCEQGQGARAAVLPCRKDVSQGGSAFLSGPGCLLLSSCPHKTLEGGLSPAHSRGKPLQGPGQGGSPEVSWASHPTLCPQGQRSCNFRPLSKTRRRGVTSGNGQNAEYKGRVCL